MSKQALIEQLLRGIDEIIPETTVHERLAGEEVLTVKLGFDPTAPDLHLGHSVILNKMKLLQDLGHRIVFIVGDFTASIGDPSGRSITRPALTKADIDAHAATYAEQIYKILDPQKTELVYNSSWLDTLSAREIIHLASGQSVARMLERDDFAKRFKNEQSISIHEFIYPLIQGYDSVALEADMELGGRDQKFNLLMGRELQKKFGKKQQCILMMPLLEGTDGVKKMSKSLGNTIDLADSADDMFGKILSISDTLMWRYYDLLSFKPNCEIMQYKAAVDGGDNPKHFKVLLALEIVARFHSVAEAEDAKRRFDNRFAKGQLPEDIPELTIQTVDSSLPLAFIIKQANMAASTSAGIRLIKQGAVRVDQQRVDSNISLDVQDLPYLIQVGKRQIAYIKLIAQ